MGSSNDDPWDSLRTYARETGREYGARGARYSSNAKKFKDAASKARYSGAKTVHEESAAHWTKAREVMRQLEDEFYEHVKTQSGGKVSFRRV